MSLLTPTKAARNIPAIPPIVNIEKPRRLDNLGLGFWVSFLEPGGDSGDSDLLVLGICDVVSEDSLLSGGANDGVSVVSTVAGAVFLRRTNMAILHRGIDTCYSRNTKREDFQDVNLDF